MRSAIDRTERTERLALRQSSLAERVERLAEERIAVVAALESRARPGAGTRSAVADAATSRAGAEAALAVAEVAATDAETAASAWSARADAVARSRTKPVSVPAPAAGRTRWSAGNLLDLVDVDAGWAEAFEAAAGEALGAVVVADLDAGRQASALEAGDHRGRSGLSARSATSGPGEGTVSVGEPVRRHVRSAAGAGAASAAIDALLDTPRRGSGRRR